MIILIAIIIAYLSVMCSTISYCGRQHGKAVHARDKTQRFINPSYPSASATQPEWDKQDDLAWKYTHLAAWSFLWPAELALLASIGLWRFGEATIKFISTGLFMSQSQKAQVIEQRRKELA